MICCQSLFAHSTPVLLFYFLGLYFASIAYQSLFLFSRFSCAWNGFPFIGILNIVLESMNLVFFYMYIFASQFTLPFSVQFLVCVLIYDPFQHNRIYSLVLQFCTYWIIAFLISLFLPSWIYLWFRFYR